MVPSTRSLQLNDCGLESLSRMPVPALCAILLDLSISRHRPGADIFQSRLADGRLSRVGEARRLVDGAHWVEAQKMNQIL